MKSYFFFLFIISIVFLTACKSESGTLSDDNNKVNAQFYLRYLEDSNEAYTDARLWELNADSTRVDKDFDYITFHGKNMIVKDLGTRGLRFRSTIVDKFQKEYVYEFWDKGQKEHHRYGASILPITDYEFVGKISKSKGVTLKVTAPDFSPKESIIILFNTTDNKTSAVTLDQLNGKKEFFIQPEQFSNVNGGANKVYLVRQQKLTKSTPALKVNITMEYYTKTKDVLIFD